MLIGYGDWKGHWKQCHLARCSIFCLGNWMVLVQNDDINDFAA